MWTGHRTGSSNRSRSINISLCAYIDVSFGCRGTFDKRLWHSAFRSYHPQLTSNGQCSSYGRVWERDWKMCTWLTIFPRWDVLHASQTGTVCKNYVFWKFIKSSGTLGYLCWPGARTSFGRKKKSSLSMLIGNTVTCLFSLISCLRCSSALR